MNFTPHQPSPGIAPYIENIFHYSGFMPDHSIERVVPTGHLFILIELDGHVRHTYDNVSLEPNADFSRAWISGMHRNFISISAHENSEMLVIQFKAFGAYPFLHETTDMFNELVIPAHEVVGDSLYELRDTLKQASGTDAKFSLAEDWLLDRLDTSKAPPKPLLEFISQLQAEPAAGLNALIEEYPGSQKKLIDEFKKYVGLTPKYYQRILRFNDLLQKIRNKDMVTWTEVAQECGFFDQSHFIKEFRHFSGMNPEEFIRNDLNQDEPNFFPLDRE